MPLSISREHQWHNSFKILETEETFKQLRKENVGNKEYRPEL
jgi:hypothetical protein